MPPLSASARFTPLPGKKTMSAALVAVAVIVTGVLSFSAGTAFRKAPDHTAAIEAHTEALTELQEGQRALVEAAGRPVVIDAELRATLAEVPVQCLRDAGGDPLGVECAWATCLQYGQSSAQRPECRAVQDLLVSTLQARNAQASPTAPEDAQ